MAAYAAVASLMNNIEQIMIHPHLSASLDFNQIQTLQQKSRLLLEFIETYNYGGEVENLERQIASAAHEAEDAIESHVADQIHAQISVSCSLHLQQIALHMDAVLEKANKLKDKEEMLRLKEEEVPTNSRSVPPETAMVGFEDELITIMDKLSDQQWSRHVISIVGMGGSGKTTLARNLYQNSFIKHHFDVRAWATVSQQYNLKGIISQLLATKCDSGEELYRFLFARRYLIILDDIWSVGAWDAVRGFFPNNGNGSRVVLTTRLSDVARDCCSSSLVTMKPLDQDKCWELFCTNAFEQENCPYPELEEAGREIARLCRGLPLATVAIGGLLRKSPRSVEYWKKVVSNLKSNPYSKEKEESLDILYLSYAHLPPRLKPCFLYMGVFKEDSEIRVTNIIELWVAEGFLKPNNTLSLEEVAEVYLKELIDRNLILVKKHRKNGKIGYCGIHDLVRDLCLKVGKHQEFFHVASNGDVKIEGPERRIICRGSVHVEYTGPLLARSMFHDYRNRSLFNHALVRVWDQVIVESGEAMYGKVNLRYISCNYSHLKDSLMWKLPTSVSRIWNLQTLIIGETLVVAPVEIWKMRQLRHVRCTSIYVPDPSDIGSCVMDSLQTLTRVVNLRASEQVCEMIPNIKDLYLHYDSVLHGYDGSLIENVSNLDRLHKLESLKLSFHPRIYGELNKMLVFPVSLNKLSLSGCRVLLEDLWMIGSLPILEVLHIHGDYAGEEWSVVEGQFSSLKVLRLECFNIGKWEPDKSHFPVLEKLLLEYVWELEEIPLDVGEIPTLELIRVDNCTESAAVSAVKIKEDQLENHGNDALQVQLRMYDHKLESFKGRLEKEGLKIDDIELEIDRIWPNSRGSSIRPNTKGHDQ